VNFDSATYGVANFTFAAGRAASVQLSGFGCASAGRLAASRGRRGVSGRRRVFRSGAGEARAGVRSGAGEARAGVSVRRRRGAGGYLATTPNSSVDPNPRPSPAAAVPLIRASAATAAATAGATSRLNTDGIT
jgi:hypothetical protein